MLCEFPRIPAPAAAAIASSYVSTARPETIRIREYRELIVRSLCGEKSRWFRGGADAVRFRRGVSLVKRSF